MAKRKKASLSQHFVDEILGLLDEVPAEQWADPELRGVLYGFTPWHRMSCVTIQTSEDDPRDIGAWKYYYSAESDGTLLKDEYELYASSSDPPLVYHRQLIEAAEAFLSIDFSKYVGEGVELFNEIGLSKIFYLQVYHADSVFRFNYCEYVAAKRMEQV